MTLKRTFLSGRSKTNKPYLKTRAKEPIIEIKIMYSNTTDEWEVRPIVNGTVDEDSIYYTDDYEDAVLTQKHMKNTYKPSLPIMPKD